MDLDRSAAVLASRIGDVGGEPFALSGQGAVDVDVDHELIQSD